MSWVRGSEMGTGMCLGLRTENVVDGMGLRMVLETEVKPGTRQEQRWG